MSTNRTSLSLLPADDADRGRSGFRLPDRVEEADARLRRRGSVLTRREAVGGLGLGAAGLLGGCGFLPTTYPGYRFRLTVAVDTPVGRRSGSSVYQVHTTKSGSAALDSPDQMTFSVRGEAVVVDLPGAALFAAMQNDYLGGLMLSLNSADDNNNASDFVPLSSHGMSIVIRNRSSMIVPRYLSKDGTISGYPKFVRFGQESRPETAKFVDPDHLEEDFGPGVRLQSISAQITGDPVTTSLTKRLSWLPRYAKAGVSLDGVDHVAISDNLARSNLGAGAFVQG